MIKSFDLSVFEHAMICRFFMLAMNRRLLSPPMFFLLVILIKNLMKHYKHSKLKMKFASCRLIYAQSQVSIMLRLIKPSWASSLVLAYTHLILVAHVFEMYCFCRVYPYHKCKSLNFVNIMCTVHKVNKECFVDNLRVVL